MKSSIKNTLSIAKIVTMIDPMPATRSNPLRSASIPIGIDRIMNTSGCEAVKRIMSEELDIEAPKTGVISSRIRENASHVNWLIMKTRPKARRTAHL
jgi:hypothetical protein